MLRIVLGDDHETTRIGVRSLLERRPGWKVCGEAANGRQAVELVTELKPDVVILDLSMPELNGVEAARQIRQLLPTTKILIFTMNQTEQMVLDVLDSGAHGIVLKSDTGANLVTAVESIASGHRFYAPSVADTLLDAYLSKRITRDHAEDTPANKLSGREREVLQSLTEGKSNKEIASLLKISARTVETHRAEIMRKLQLTSVAELVRYAIRNGLVKP